MESADQQAEISLNRLKPRLEAHFAEYARSYPTDWAAFNQRLEQHFGRLFTLLLQLYGGQYDFFYHLEELLFRLAGSWTKRPPDLKQLDADREARPDWFLSNQMVGGVCYVDLFAGDLSGLCEQIPYFKELGLNYLHLMPLYLGPLDKNDGGYAVSSYRQVNPSLGTIEQLEELACELRRQGISLVLDFVFNHTSDECEWAEAAKSSDPLYQDYYRTFPDRTLPDAYEKTLREIFPEEHPGQFTYSPELGRWVWTTFHDYQWDLNYANPAVFIRMAEEMLFLANLGVEVLRLDAVAFTWKELGTSCENLPEAHLLIQAFNALCRIAAPAMLFKSEAIVHPDQVIQYIDLQECQLSYNPLLMALLWNSLATREVRLLKQALSERHQLPPGTTWVNYIRCHDDIGWTFSDEDAARLGINGYDHRRFLNAFYTGRFQGSFARGLPFQENPRTGDVRISGSAASLAGLEKALYDEVPAGLDKALFEQTSAEAELAINRLLLIHGVILTVGGIPVIYLGDEVGTMNDYSYRQDPLKVKDSRWVHRPRTDWQRMLRRRDPDTVEGQIFQRLERLIDLRRKNPAFQAGELQVVDTGDDSLLGYVCQAGGQRVLVLANFNEAQRTVPANLLRLYGLGYRFQDAQSREVLPPGDLLLAPYQFIALQPVPH